MITDVQQDISASSGEEPTIASMYNGPTRGLPVRKWIEKHRCEEGNTKDLYLSDDSEGRFVGAMNAGAQITRTQVYITLK